MKHLTRKNLQFLNKQHIHVFIVFRDIVDDQGPYDDVGSFEKNGKNNSLFTGVSLKLFLLLNFFFFEYILSNYVPFCYCDYHTLC